MAVRAASARASSAAAGSVEKSLDIFLTRENRAIDRCVVVGTLSGRMTHSVNKRTGAGRTMLFVADAYCKHRDISRGYAANVLRTARKMDAAGITADNINGEIVSHWLSSMRAKGLSPRSVHSERRTAITIWKFGIEEGMISAPLRNLPKVKVPRKVVRAFTRDQCTRAVKSFSECDFSREIGVFKKSKCPVGLWMEAWTRLCYESACRFTDGYALRAESVVPGGVAFTASKTGQPVIRRVSARTSQLLDQLIEMSPDGTVFSWAVSRRWAFANIKKCFVRLGLKEGRSQWLRRAAATHAEMLEKGAGAKVLGHRTQGLFEKHYCDYTQMIEQMPSAPLLD